MINAIGEAFHTSNVENNEYSYITEAGSKKYLLELLDFTPSHYTIDLRFEDDDIVVLIETKVDFEQGDELQLEEYLLQEKALHPNKKIIAILANTSDGKIKAWKSNIDEAGFLSGETAIDTMEHYKSLFSIKKYNNRELVLRNTYNLNELLHKKDIKESLRSQFVGTALLYVKNIISKKGYSTLDEITYKELQQHWLELSPTQIRAGIEDSLTGLLNGSDNKDKKVKLIQDKVLDNPKIKNLKIIDWVEILIYITKNIYSYIDYHSAEGQDILNLFFIAFNKYTGKADKNQAFTPDHITEFMCRITEMNRFKRVLDATCGSGSFLVQALVKQIADCNNMKGTAQQKAEWIETVKREHIFGIEVEEVAYGLATTNMLIHGDGNSNIKFGSLFENEEFIRKANPDIILMNPPYNANPLNIPKAYKDEWDKLSKSKKTENSNKERKEDPTKGLVFIQFISDCLKRWNDERSIVGQSKKTIKLAVLLPVSAAIGTSKIIAKAKEKLLEDNTLEAVFTLPNEIFYPGASVSACCMVFTLGNSHFDADGNSKETFFGYFKEDGFKKKKNLGRVEQFDKDGNSIWKQIENTWLKTYKNGTVLDGLSAKANVSAKDEWLCEAYMNTDYSKLSDVDFQQVLNNYLAYKVKTGAIHES